MVLAGFHGDGHGHEPVVAAAHCPAYCASGDSHVAVGVHLPFVVFPCGVVVVGVDHNPVGFEAVGTMVGEDVGEWKLAHAEAACFSAGRVVGHFDAGGHRVDACGREVGFGGECEIERFAGSYLAADRFLDLLAAVGRIEGLDSGGGDSAEVSYGHADLGFSEVDAFLRKSKSCGCDILLGYEQSADTGVGAVFLESELVAIPGHKFKIVTCGECS